MLKIIVGAIVGLYFGSADVYAATVTEGFGTATCGQFASLYLRDPKNIERDFFYWAQGFMSGMNIISSGTRGFYMDFDTTSMEEQMSELRAYCDKHPLERYLNAVIEVYGRLNRKDYSTDKK